MDLRPQSDPWTITHGKNSYLLRDVSKPTPLLWNDERFRRDVDDVFLGASRHQDDDGLS